MKKYGLSYSTAIRCHDHRFFKMFLKSAVAEDTLHSVATDKLGVQEGVRVKLLGEVIRGL